MGRRSIVFVRDGEETVEERPPKSEPSLCQPALLLRRKKRVGGLNISGPSFLKERQQTKSGGLGVHGFQRYNSLMEL